METVMVFCLLGFLGFVFFYDPSDGRLNDLNAQSRQLAKTLYMEAPLRSRHQRSALNAYEFRFTFLTPRGPRVVIEDKRQFGENASRYSEMFLALGLILEGVVALR